MFLAIVIGIVSALLAVAPVAAHEERQVGEFEFVVGFIQEPVFVGQKSGLEFLVTRDGEPVEGLEETLTAEVIKDDQRRDLPLGPRFGQPGWYQSFFFPTVDGPYTFHISGTIDGTDIDETFTSSPEGFNEVQAATSGQFPDQFPPMNELVEQARQGADAAALVPVALGLGAAGAILGVLGLAMAVANRRRGA
jgi:hypothetical protein